jgi:FlaA1/EpsC-like NDP-sugar epimerase
VTLRASSSSAGPSTPIQTRRTLLIGSPASIAHLALVLESAGGPMRAVGAVAIDAESSAGAWPEHLPNLGTMGELETIVRAHGIESALVSMPMAMGRLAERCSARLVEMGVEVRRIPTPVDLLEGRAGRAVGSVDFSRLLDRPSRPLDESAIRGVLEGKRVLITGAGGSIGSQIARIVARFNPEGIVLMDRSENGLFEINRQMHEQCAAVARKAMLHDVVDERRTMEVVGRESPQVIFHAAAHKHVPMMEDHPREAVNNNFFGTKSIADAAVAAGAERFVMISTDKAVNPTSVMGATKRTAELYVQSLAGSSPTLMSMVRFGNVLGSACSVVPIWTQQLAEGGPITVTDRRMTRFFMTIPEAAALVIQAAALEKPPGGSIFLLDMGEPIRIVDLAERFVRQHGLEPGRDVPIVFTGARPGEKLHEELAYASEDARATAHASVRLLKTTRPSPDRIARMARAFAELRFCDDPAAILAALRDAVPQMSCAAA